MWLFWLGLFLLLSVPLTVLILCVGVHFYIRWGYLHNMVRIFQEKPLFIVPKGEPDPRGEDVRFPTSDGLTLAGCYIKSDQPRKGVILFGLEFGSDRWSCVHYCEHLIRAGYDVFAFESRNQGESEHQKDYTPLQWVTEYEVEDTRAAVRYLQARPDASPHGIGLFGISKGAGAGVQVAAENAYIRCFVTDGMFAAYTTMVPYMRHWYRIYNSQYAIQGLLPSWFYGHLGLVALRWTEQERGCRFVHLEKAIRRLSGRPLLMIHGENDTYIKEDMARALFDKARRPKELWIVKNAKHNQALQIAEDEYRRRILEFFDQHLATASDELTQVA